MPDDLINEVRRLLGLYERGILTTHEFAHRLFDVYSKSDEGDENVAAVFAIVPDDLMPTLQAELHELADGDFYLFTFGIGDTRTHEEVHADALARQPALRRVCRLLTPLVLARLAG